MKYLLTLGFLVSTILAFSQNEEIGRLYINSLFNEKNIQKSYAYLDPGAQAKITEKALKNMKEQAEVQLGKFLTIIETNSESNTYYYFCEFEKMKLDLKISFNDNKKIIGFLFFQHKEFNKTKLGIDHNIKSVDIELHGTLVVPEINNIKKLFVFVHGSGPQDRDETINENKPFRDIAEKLFQKGVSTYRFDKRTFSNPESFNDKKDIDDEVTNDIINIVKYFRKDKQFAEYEIILLGHSLGAYLLPRIANKLGQINKIILLAGNARSIDKLVIEQYDYLLKLSSTPELKNDAEKMKGQIRYLHSNDFNSNSPKENLPFNMSAYYWKSVLKYNPLKEVKKIRIPILILQGERDYQVSMKDFELWKNSLKRYNNARFISYPKLNHLFMVGEGAANHSEYNIKGNVDAKVINDIFDFVIKN
jgi:uncharacterized protein